MNSFSQLKLYLKRNVWLCQLFRLYLLRIVKSSCSLKVGKALGIYLKDKGTQNHSFPMVNSGLLHKQVSEYVSVKGWGFAPPAGEGVVAGMAKGAAPGE